MSLAAVTEGSPELPRSGEGIARKSMPTREMAERHGYSVSFLTHARVRGDGPPYMKVGRSVRYDVAATDAWFAARQVGSTSEADVKARR